MSDWRSLVTVDEGQDAAGQLPVKAPVAGTSWRDKVDAQPDGESTFESRAGTFGQGATSGVIQSAPVVAGAIGGAQLGAAIGAAGGPFAPATVPIGAGIGAIAGGWAGYKAGQTLNHMAAEVKIPWSDTFLTFENTESVPKNLRPYAVAGETFGASAAFAAAPYAAVANGFRFSENLAGRFFNRIIDTAASSPLSFMAAEISAASGAAVGAGAAETAYPGSGGARFAGEIIGGTMNPGKWIIAGTRAGVNRFTGVVQSFGTDARQNRAAQVLQEIIVEAGEDPKRIADAIRARSQEFPNLKLTAGQLTESPALLALEADLAAKSAQFGQASRQAAQDGLESMRTMIAALDTVGTPYALRAAAQMRQDYFTTMLNTRLHVAEQQALEAAAKIDPGNAVSRADFGKQVNTIMDEAMGAVRATERELWGKVNKEVPTATHTIRARLDELRSSRLPEEPLPAIVEGFATRTAGQQITSGEVQIFRSRMLSLARESAAKNEWSDARIYGELAEAAMDDLTVGISVAKPGDAAAFDAARAWSRQLNETFGGTFAGKSLAVAGEGQNRIPPELLMQKAFGGGREAGELHFRQLQEAAEMAGKEHVSRLIDVQERTIRFAAADVLDANGKVRPDRMARFMKNNKELLDRFPEVRQQLATAEKAERFLQSTKAGVSRATKAIADESAFAQVIAGQDPSLAVGKSLISANPEQDFMALAKLAERGGKQAKDGLKSAVLSYAYQRAGGDTDFSFAAYRQVFEGPLAKTKGMKDLTLKTMLFKAGLLTEKDHNQIVTFLRRAEGIENAMASRAPLSEALAVDDAMYDLVLRIAGTRVAAHAPVGNANSLVVAGAASRAARQVFDKIPKMHVRTILAEAAQNPEFMTALLEKRVTRADQMKLALQMNAYFWQAGVTTWPDDETP